MARAANPAMVRLGHKGHRAPLLVGHLLDPVFVDDVVVGHGQSVGEPEVDLLLPGPGFALGALDRDTRSFHPLADRAEEGLVVSRREDVVVEDVWHRGRQVDEVLGVGFGEGLFEQIELELRAEHGLEPELARPLDLRPQHLPWRRPHRLLVMPSHVTQHHRRGVEPRDRAQGVEIRHQVEVAVPGLPARHLVAGHRVHLHVHREQVVAALGRLALVRRLDEVLGVDALAHQAALHVREGDDHRVDRTFGDLVSEVLFRQHAASVWVCACRGLGRQSARTVFGPRAGLSSTPRGGTAPQR